MSEMAATREALPVQQVAVLLGVCDKTIRRWIAAGEIEAIRVGPRLLRIPRSELVGLRRRKNGKK